MAATYGAVEAVIDEEDTLSFSVREQVRPIIETVPLERAGDAYVRMMRNEARFRMVITNRTVKCRRLRLLDIRRPR